MDIQKIQNQIYLISPIPIDAKSYYRNLGELLYEIEEFDIWLTWHPGQLIYLADTGKVYVWKEWSPNQIVNDKKIVGLIEGGKNYPDEYIVDGVDLSNKLFNLVEIDYIGQQILDPSQFGLWVVNNLNELRDYNYKLIEGRKAIVINPGEGHRYMLYTYIETQPNPENGVYVINSNYGGQWIAIGEIADYTLVNVSDLVILNKIKNVDGHGSGLDSDTVDGKHASELSSFDVINEVHTITFITNSITVNNGGAQGINNTIVSINGLEQVLGIDYTISGNIITFTENLEVGDIVTIHYKQVN